MHQPARASGSPSRGWPTLPGLRSARRPSSCERRAVGRARSARPRRRARPRPSAGGCGRSRPSGVVRTAGSPGRPATDVTYSQIGSRGLPWTRLNVRLRAALGQGRQPVRGRPARSAARVHSIAARASGLNQSISRRRRPPRRGCRATPTAPSAGEPGDDAVGLRAVADDVAEVPDGVDRADACEDRVEGDEVGMDVRQDGDAHRSEPSSESRRIGAVASPRRRSPRGRVARPGARRSAGGRAGTTTAGRPRFVDDDEAVPSGPAAGDTADDARSGRRRAPGRAAATAAELRVVDGRRASRRRATPPGARSGNASSTSSASGATARAVTAGQRSRWRGSRGERLRPDRARPRRGRRGRSAADGRLEERAPSCRPTRRAATRSRGQRGRERDARGSRRRCRGRRTARRRARAEDGDRREAVDDVADRDRGRVADRP